MLACRIRGQLDGTQNPPRAKQSSALTRDRMSFMRGRNQPNSPRSCRTERRISRDGRGQRSSRSATAVPERERPDRCRIFAVPSRAVCAWPRIQIIEFCAPALPLVKSSMPPLVLSPVCRADRRGGRRVLGRDGSRRRPKRLGSRCLPVRRGLGPAGAGRRAQRGRAVGVGAPVLRLSVACGFECPHPAFLCPGAGLSGSRRGWSRDGNPLRGASRRIR
jgi:hypothetical protein